MQRVYDNERPRTNLIAGGTGALGGALVEMLLRNGERVCVPYVHDGGAKALRERHPDEVREGLLRVSPCDVTNADAVAALCDVLIADWGPLWLACSVAGGWAGGESVEELTDVTLFDRMVRQNLRTAVVVSREGLRRMGRAGGRVVLVGSRTVDYPVPGQAAYSASKAAVLSLVATLAEELRGSGRTANAVVPKVINTPANRTAMPNADHERWVPPRAIAKVITWLASADSWPVSGAAIPVYGDS